jgi:serine phosphatase RsbU (regulator of sigma subunit)
MVWLYLATGGSTLFVLLTLFLQIVRFSADIRLTRIRVVIGLLVAAAVIFQGWLGSLQFLVFFLLAVWIFNFEVFTSTTFRQRIFFTIAGVIGLIFLSILNFQDNLAAGYETVRPGVYSAPDRITDSLNYLLSGLLPYLPDLIIGLKRILLALFIVLPVKILLRPIADWLRFSLRIRTKLVLSYILSSVIPALLLVLILLAGNLFMTGGFWQLFIGGIVDGRTDTLLALWGSSDASSDIARLFHRREISEDLRSMNMSAVLADITPSGRFAQVDYLGKDLPGIIRTDSIVVEVLPEDYRGLPLTPQSRIFRITRSPFTELVSADTLIFKLSENNFSGVAWLEGTPYLTRWMRQDETIIGLFQSLTLGHLAEMKLRSGSDLLLFRPGDDVQLTSKLTDVGIGLDGFTPYMNTEDTGTERLFHGPAESILEGRLTFPVVLPCLVWTPGRGLEESATVVLARTSLRSLFSTLLSPQYVINRMYLAAFIVMTAIFGAILILVVLVGFGVASGITKTIKKVREGTQRLSRGDLTASIEVKTKDELGQLAGSFNLMVADLNRMLEEVKEKERMEAELDAAKAIQTRLLPENVPILPGFEVAAASVPAKQVGGDYYDFLTLPGNRTGFAVGDVSGKGMPAALLMANLQASLRTLASQDLAPEELVRRLNNVLHGNTSPQMFATFFFASLDVDHGRFNYVNAGHNYPILCGNGRLEYLSEGGLVLGVRPDEVYVGGEVSMECGEIVALYSDGITEATDQNSREFGEERLLSLLQYCNQETADGILMNVLKDVETFCGTPQDDVTLMVIKRI